MIPHFRNLLEIFIEKTANTILPLLLDKEKNTSSDNIIFDILLDKKNIF